MLELFRFFFLFEKWVPEDLREALRIPVCSSVLLVGHKSSGRTSFLFHYAMSYGLEDRPVLMLCSRTKSQKSGSLLLPDVPGMTVPPASALKKIKIKYVENGNELREYLLKHEMFPENPELIILDDLNALFHSYIISFCCNWEFLFTTEFFFQKNRPERADFVKVLALLQNASQMISSRSGKECLVMVSDLYETMSEPPQNRILLSERWIPLTITLDGKELILKNKKSISELDL